MVRCGNVEVTRGRDGKHRILVVANETVGGEALLEEIGNRCRGRNCEVILVVTPALAGVARRSTGRRTPTRRLSSRGSGWSCSLIEIDRLGLRAKGEIGDSDPNVAIEDALRVFPADEIVISTHPPERSRWLEHGVVERARERDRPADHPRRRRPRRPAERDLAQRPAPSSGSSGPNVASGVAPPRGAARERPALATVQSIASQLQVASATWTQTISVGQLRASHWTPPTTPCRASRPRTTVERLERPCLSPPGRRRRNQTPIAARP